MGRDERVTDLSKKLLETEGHTIIAKGRTNIRYYVRDYESKLYSLEDDQP